MYLWQFLETLPVPLTWTAPAS